MSHPKGPVPREEKLHQSQQRGGGGGRCASSKHSISLDVFDIKKLAPMWVHYFPRSIGLDLLESCSLLIPSPD